MKIFGYGSIKLFLTEIKNILHVKNCTSNFLSIEKNSKEKNYDIIFSSKDVFFFQDVTYKRMIGEVFFFKMD